MKIQYEKKTGDNSRYWRAPDLNYHGLIWKSTFKWKQRKRFGGKYFDRWVASAFENIRGSVGYGMTRKQAILNITFQNGETLREKQCLLKP